MSCPGYPIRSRFINRTVLGGLQSTSTAVGDTIAEKVDTRSGSSKKLDEATSSLGEFGKGEIIPVLYRVGFGLVGNFG